MPPHQIQQELFGMYTETVTVSQGTIFQKQYHTAEPWAGDWKQMESWCRECFGDPGSVWDDFSSNNRWYMNSRRFWFRDEQDLLLFLLKWA